MPTKDQITEVFFAADEYCIPFEQTLIIASLNSLMALANRLEISLQTIIDFI